MLNFLQAWGFYAPLLLLSWISIAYGVAYVRVRKEVGDTQRAYLFSQALVSWSFSYIPFLGFLFDDPSPAWWFTYGCMLLWPLLIAVTPRIPRRRRAKWAPPALWDIMRFRRPWSAEGAQPGFTLLPILLVALVAAAFAALSLVGLGLRPCGWLDTTLLRSGCLRSIIVDRETIQSVAVSPDGLLLAEGGSGQVVRIYRVADGHLQRTLAGHSDWVTSVTFSPDGGLLASGSWDGSVRLWHVADGVMLRTLAMPTPRGSETIIVTFSPDGLLIAASAMSSDVQLWRVSDGAVVGSIPSVGSDIAFSPDGTMLAVERPKSQISLWSLPGLTPLQTFGQHPFSITALSFAPDGQTIASAAGDEMIRIWRVADGGLLQTFSSPARSNLVFSPDGALIASGGIHYDGQQFHGLVEVWNVASGTRVASWAGHRNMVNSVAFAPDGSFLASGSSWASLRLWKIP